MKHKFAVILLCIASLLGCFWNNNPVAPRKADDAKPIVVIDPPAKADPDPVPNIVQKELPLEKPDLSSPTAALESARKAAARRDWPAFCALLTEDSRDGVSASLLYAAAAMSKDFPPGDAKFEEEVRARFKPYFDVLKKHGITDEQVRTMAMLPQKDHNALRKHVPVKDRPALAADLLAALAPPGINGPLSRDAKLVDLPPQGDRVEAFLQTPQARTPIYFQRVNDTWQVGLTLSLNSFFQPARTGSALTLRGHKAVLVAVAVSGDGQRIVSASQEGTVKIWDAGQEKHSFNAGGLTGLITAIGLTADGQRFILAAKDPVPKIYDAAGKVEHSLTGHNDYVYGAAITPDGSRVVTASFDATIMTWDGKTGKRGITIGKSLMGNGHFKTTISADGRRLAASVTDQTVHVWDAERGDEIRVINMQGGRHASLALSPDGKRLFTTTFDQTAIHLWEVDTGKDLLTLPGAPGMAIACLALSTDGKRLAAGDANGGVHLWDAATGQKLHTLHDHEGRVMDIALTADGRRAVTGGFDQTVKVWDLP